jgi:hypothetical protein
MPCPCEQRTSTAAAAQFSQFARHTDCSVRSHAALLCNICFLHLYKSGQAAGGVSTLARIRWLTREFGDAVAACGHVERRCGHPADGDEDGKGSQACVRCEGGSSAGAGVFLQNCINWWGLAGVSV